MLKDMKKRVYLDAAAAHPVRKAALRAFLSAQEAYGNPSTPHAEGQAALAILENAREKIARETGAKADAVIFTSGATESNALAIIGHVQSRIDAGISPSALRVLYAPTQHASVTGAIEAVRRLGVSISEVPLAGFQLDMNELEKLLKEGIALITLDVICSETGTRFDTRAVRKLIDGLPAAQRPVFHVDATQAPLVENMERTRLGADLITFDAQKVGGVRGIGVLIAPLGVSLSPIAKGGGQERGLRSGTPAPALAAAFAAALQEASRRRPAFIRKAARIKAYLKKELAAIPNVVINEGGDTAPTILNISALGRDTDYLVALLDEAGFAVSTRSSCETDADGSRVVASFTKDSARAKATLRISLHDRIRSTDARAFMRAIAKALSFVDTA
jgi:cysteine desulfurase